jgi:hypothetical protein
MPIHLEFWTSSRSSYNVGDLDLFVKVTKVNLKLFEGQLLCVQLIRMYLISECM